MALPVPPNTTCAIFRNSGTPTNPPVAVGVPCFLRGDYRAGCDRSGSASAPWTHVLLIDRDVDLRDAYQGALTYADQDHVCIPDENGTRFRVVFIERVGLGTAQDHKRAYLDRAAPTWPTDHL